MPPRFENYLGRESVAATIRSFEIQFVPGLFETKDYARAVTQLAQRDPSAEEIERRVGLRLHRQHLLATPNPPRIWSVIDEAVLRRPIGGRAVLRAQLRRLIEVAAMPHVTIQVVPFARGGHAGASGSFSLMRFTLEVMDQLSGEALTPAKTIAFMEQAA